MIFEGYREIEYFELINQLKEFRRYNKKSNAHLAVELGLRASQTIVNAQNYNEQKVKDANLTKLMEYLGLDGFIVWKKGVKHYYINSNIK